MARRDLAKTKRTLEAWFAARFAVDEVSVSDLHPPSAGMSNETILGRAAWSTPDGAAALDFVVRVEPRGHQLFVQPDALFQARVMQVLALTGSVPVPEVKFVEADPAVLGAPFFVMSQVHGRVPSDVPSWHVHGWTADLGSNERSRMCDNGLVALAALHAIPVTTQFEFLAYQGDGSHLDRYLAHVVRWHEWATPSLVRDRATIDAALEHVMTNKPDDPAAGIVWGDARLGNIVFDDDLSVAALLDWEGATLGPPEIDVAWWVMFEEFLCEARGLARPDGAPDRAEMLARYEQLSGRPLRHIEYYEILACLVLSLINSRLAELLLAAGRTPDAVATEFLTRVTAMAAGRLAD